MTYKKTHFTGLIPSLIARERKDEDLVFDIFIETKQLFCYKAESNRLFYTGGWSAVSPELLGMVSDIAKYLHNKFCPVS